MAHTTMNKNMFEILDTEYPVLGSFTEKVKNTKYRKPKQNKKNIAHFVISSSYKDVKALKYNNLKSEDPRSRIFAHMDDKEIVAKSLTCTKACKNVIRNYTTEEFGVCHRETCSFAHCLEELEDPMCAFDSVCRFRWGKTQRDGYINTRGKCMYRHPDETRDDWVKRTGHSLPDLPETADKTRKPDKMGKIEKDHIHEFNENISMLSFTPPPKVIHTPDAPYKTNETRLDVEPEDLTRKKLDFSEYSSKSDQIMNIIVPTKELAEIAVKAAFDRGNYNIRIVVE
jgi:hypothetical protein